MKTVFSFLFFTSLVFAQQDLKAIQDDYNNLMKTTAYGKDAKVGKYCEMRGFKMYYEVYGSGEPLLLIHGNGGSINNFVKQIPVFSKNYKVIIADSRAQRKSIDTKDSLSYEMIADDYAELLNKIGVSSANVIGWSDGGIEGLLLAIRHPEKVKKLMVTGANLEPDTTAVETDVHDWAQGIFAQLKNIKDKTDTQKHDFKLFRLLVEQPHIPVADLKKIKCPTLVVGGDHDILRPGHTLTIFQNIENAYLWILPNSGHSTLVVYSDEFNKKADEFFKAPYRKIFMEGRFF
ncbi:MAG TPA: alpha/beta hydrolase [Flavobacterium sp.]|uniref:alpha/beta fold hydrolase n=1 Tax=Flavobacterium sp. TaxID=239 RepID=UPI002B516B99|nr:alpha/beta hydrolase [Flavobacterium sp.]HNP32466.1 alpha/beta hydrolase [Flavobacterium sp.]